MNIENTRFHGLFGPVSSRFKGNDGPKAVTNGIRKIGWNTYADSAATDDQRANLIFAAVLRFWF
jgi:hypothetical protein